MINNQQFTVQCTVYDFIITVNLLLVYLSRFVSNKFETDSNQDHKNDFNVVKNIR